MSSLTLKTKELWRGVENTPPVLHQPKKPGANGVNSFGTRCMLMRMQPTTSVWWDEKFHAWESPWLCPEMCPWVHLLTGQLKRKPLDYWLKYYDRLKALLLTNRLTSIVDIVCTLSFWDIWDWNHMMDDLWFASTIRELVGLHLHVLGAAVRIEKLHYFISFLLLAQFYFVIWYQRNASI